MRILFKLLFASLIGALVVTHAMLRRLTSWRCIIIIYYYYVMSEKLQVYAFLCHAQRYSYDDCQIR